MSDTIFYLLGYLGVGTVMATVLFFILEDDEDTQCDILTTLVLWPLILLATVVMILTGKRYDK
jgi:hypothetical protein